ncbi:MAG: PQQ-binding-like beta-propeller repeat protein, partial [Planctomycetes bacterium]|nr:PQQ-binding-like beta-propeller repeat protein [Planctomycetota bacterium]
MKQLTIFLLLTTLGAQADAVEVGGVQAGRVVVIGGDAIPLGSMLQAVGVQGGVAVHIAKPGETELTAALRTDPGILVHGLYPDSSSAAQARKFFQQSDCSGPVTALAWEHGQLPYASNFVDLLVVTRSEAQTSKGEWDRVLAPGGILLTNDRAFQIPAAFSPKQIPVPNWRAAVKPWPKGMDEWTHWYHSASGNAVGKDTLIGPPRRLQWTAGPKWSKSHNRNSTSFSSMVSADGRFFTIEDTTPASLLNVQAHWFLVARSAFNGVVLWRKELPSWNVRVWGEQTNSQAKKRLVAVGDRLYVPLGSDAPLSLLDAVTGKPIREYSEAPSPDEFVVHDGRIFLSDRDAVFALDAETGGRLWSRKDGREIAASGDTVCLFTDKG